MATPFLNSPGRGGGVFISHHSSRYEEGKAVKAALAEAGIRGWLAPDDVTPGSAFDTQIVEQIERSDAIVLLLTEEADRSRHVKRELMLADDEDIPVFPVRLERIEADGLAYFLKDRQWIDWIGGQGDGLGRLVAAVRGLYAAPERIIPGPVPRPRTWWPFIAGAVVGLCIVGGIIAWQTIPREPPFVVRPGLWLNKREAQGILYPEKIAEEETRQITSMIESDPNPEECITEDVAHDPDVKLFDPGNKSKCALTGFQMARGRMSGYLICPIQGAKDASMSIVFQGTYGRETIVMDSVVTIAQPSGTLRFKARDSSHWIAEKCPTER